MISLISKSLIEAAKHGKVNSETKPIMPSRAIPFFIVTLLVRFKALWCGHLPVAHNLTVAMPSTKRYGRKSL
jgi:hypothetical protein